MASFLKRNVQDLILIDTEIHDQLTDHDGADAPVRRLICSAIHSKLRYFKHLTSLTGEILDAMTSSLITAMEKNKLDGEEIDEELIRKDDKTSLITAAMEKKLGGLVIDDDGKNQVVECCCPPDAATAAATFSEMCELLKRDADALIDADREIHALLEGDIAKQCSISKELVGRFVSLKAAICHDLVAMTEELINAIKMLQEGTDDDPDVQRIVSYLIAALSSGAYDDDDDDDYEDDEEEDDGISDVEEIAMVEF